MNSPPSDRSAPSAYDWRTPYKCSKASPGARCQVYRHQAGLVIHIVNLTGLNEWPGYAEELVSVGPVRAGLAGSVGDWKEAESLVSGEKPRLEPSTERVASFEIPEVRDHGVIVVREQVVTATSWYGVVTDLAHGVSTAIWPIAEILGDAPASQPLSSHPWQEN